MRACDIRVAYQQMLPFVGGSPTVLPADDFLRRKIKSYLSKVPSAGTFVRRLYVRTFVRTFEGTFVRSYELFVLFQISRNSD